MYIVQRSLLNMEKLKKVEVEKTARVEETSRSLGKGLSIATYKSIDIINRYHLNLQETNE